MRRRLAAPAAATILAAALGLPAPALAQSTADARLQGSFQLAGRITTAVNVFGERRGQTINRVWTFTPQCPTGACSSVTLTRPRAGGTDTVTLTERSGGHYAGSGRFYAPLRCAGHLYARGELVPFQVSVTVTTALDVNGETVAGRISATYANAGRINLTRCVQPPSHDAASYHGYLTQSS